MSLQVIFKMACTLPHYPGDGECVSCAVHRYNAQGCRGTKQADISPLSIVKAWLRHAAYLVEHDLIFMRLQSLRLLG